MDGKKIFVVVALLLVTTTMGCSEKTQLVKTIGSERMTYSYNENGIQVFHDNMYNVTCWEKLGIEGGGISCIPDWQLTPPQNMSSDCNCS